MSVSDHPTTALLLIDVQESFRVRPYWSDKDVPAFFERTNRLVAGSVAAGIPIVQVFHVDPPNSADNPFSRASGLIKPMAELAPFEPALVIEKHRHSALVGSGFVGVPIDDTQCGFRVFRAEILRRMRLSARGYEIETEMLIKLRRLGGQVASVPVSAVYNGRDSKLRPIRDTTRTCFLAVYYRFLQPV